MRLDRLRVVRLLISTQNRTSFRIFSIERNIDDLPRRHISASPEIALFLSLAVGYWVGKFQFGKFQLGGVAGSLLAAVLISQVGIQIDNGIKAVLVDLH
ncbi:hypothetical protein [Shinella sp. WSJ-2]|uniref:aspartate-alanine antiporter-like transporter n=1 Tax=Shinella sp. WSJ-2 TaxID=2303749 RepID=UPI001FDF07AC|nr:hypothetical protein [Shinella sp. WSJ-2]